MLFSATQTRKVEDLARISLKKEPLYVGVDDNKDKATVDGLEQVLSHKLLHSGQIQRSQFPFHPFYWNPFSISWNHISFTRWSEITETARTPSSFSLLMQWSLSLSPVSGLCGVSIREALPAAFHLPEEEPQEEADGLLLFLHVCEIPLWTAQLHRPARHGHPRKFSRRSLHESYLNIQVVKKTEPLKVKVLWLYLWKISWLMLEANGFSFVLFYPLIFEGWRWADVDLQLFCAFLCFVSFRRANKSRPNVPPPSSSSATLTPASCCAQTWQLEGWTSPRWTGSCSTTLQMTPRSISFFFFCCWVFLIAYAALVCHVKLLSWTKNSQNRTNFKVDFSPTGVHPQGGSNRQRYRWPRPRPPHPAARRTRLPAVPQTGQGEQTTCLVISVVRTHTDF